MSNHSFTKEIVRGLIGGFVGTIIMDLVIAGFFLAVGTPVALIYAFIGEVTATFFLRIGIDLPGGVPLGALIHFFLGLGLGGLFGGAVSKIGALRIDSLKKGVLLGMVYIEIVSQPILVAAPLLRTMTASDILQWYGLSTFMHLIYGGVLGGIMRHTARPGNSRK